MSRSIIVKFVDEDYKTQTRIFSEKELKRKLVFATLGKQEQLVGILDDNTGDPLFILKYPDLCNVTFVEE